MRRSSNFTRRAATRTGKFKSALEAGVAGMLEKRTGAPAVYEPKSFAYTIDAKYTPDFLLPDGSYLETKGYFPAEDRRKMVNVKRCNPGVTIRICLSAPNAKISKGSKTTLAEWCVRQGFDWCTPSTVPEEWLR